MKRNVLESTLLPHAFFLRYSLFTSALLLYFLIIYYPGKIVLSTILPPSEFVRIRARVVIGHILYAKSASMGQFEFTVTLK